MKHIPFFLRNYKIIFLLSTIAIIVVCCKTTQPVPKDKSSSANSAPKDPLAPVESDVAIARVHWHGITLDSLNKGYSIFYDKCTDCHDIKEPKEFTAYEWNAIMHKMGRKAKLDSNQYYLVLHYILTKREAILGTGK